MNIYVVVYDSAYGKEIDKIFFNEVEANIYCQEENKNFPAFCHEVEKHQVV